MTVTELLVLLDYEYGFLAKESAEHIRRLYNEAEELRKEIDVYKKEQKVNTSSTTCIEGVPI